MYMGLIHINPKQLSIKKRHKGNSIDFPEYDGYFLFRLETEGVGIDTL